MAETYRIRRFCAALALTLILPAGCEGDPFAAATAPLGTYDLVAVDGRPLPTVVHDHGGTVLTLHETRLHFDGAGRVEVYRVLEIVSPWPGETGIHGSSYQMAYRARGRFFDMGQFQPCPPHANCAGFESGDVRGRSLVVTSAIHYPGLEMVYRRR